MGARYHSRYDGGFSYIAVLLAIALLALCAAPAADAVRNAASAPAASAAQLQNLLCVKSRIETVSAEPYQNLLQAAAGAAVPSTIYSLAATGACPKLNVYLAIVNVDPEGKTTYPPLDTGLLQLVVTVGDEILPAGPTGPPAPPAPPGTPASEPGALSTMSLATILGR